MKNYYDHKGWSDFRNAFGIKIINKPEKHTRSRVLLIEDETPDLEKLRDYLREKGYEVFSARDEQEFWKHILGSQIELVIFDVCLKRRLGADVYQALLQFQKERQMPVIFKNGLTPQSRPAMAIRDEDYVFFPEPVDIEVLCLEMESLLDHKKLTRAA